MFKMFAQIFTSITVLAAALEKLAQAAFHLTRAAEEKADTFAQEISLENAEQLRILRERHAAAAKQGLIQG